MSIVGFVNVVDFKHYNVDGSFVAENYVFTALWAQLIECQLQELQIVI